MDNAAKVVELRVEDPWAALEPIVMPRVRQLTRNHELNDLSRVELALERHLVTEAREEAKVLGLTVVRASVSLDIDEDELQRERDKLQDEHYQEMEELRTFHRARLEQVREQQQRLLNAAKAQHERELAALREQHRRELHEAWQKDYRGVTGDPLPELILAKLTTRPGGIDQKDLDDVIRLLAEKRWEEYAMPLQLLSQHEGSIQDWQREKLIEAVLNGLAAKFPPAQPAVNEEPIEAEVDHQATEAVLIDPPPKLDPPEPDDRPG